MAETPMEAVLTPVRLENRIGESADAQLTSAEHPSIFRHIAPSQKVVTSFLMSLPGRLHHEDGASTPRLHCQPHCG